MTPFPSPILSNTPRLLSLLAACSLAASTAFSQALSDAKDEEIHGPSAGQAKLPGNPNTPKMGVGLWMMAHWTPEIVFQNVFNQSQDFQGAPDKALDLDPFGWVKSLKPGQTASSRLLFNFGPHYPAGDYVLLYDGEGQIILESASDQEKFTTLHPAESSPGRMLFHVTPDNGLRLTIKSTNPSNHLRNIRLLLPGCEKTYATEIFARNFVNRTKVLDFVRYHAVQNQWMAPKKTVLWENRTTPQHQTQANRKAGWAIEYIVACANALNNDLWYHIPDRADENYVRQAAKYIKANLKPNLKLYLEYANEVWNSNYGGTQLMMELARADGIDVKGISWNAATVVREYYLKHAAHLMDVFDSEFQDRSRIKRVCAGWAKNFERFGEPALDKNGMARQFDVYSIASYFGGGLPDNPDYLKMADSLVVDSVSKDLESMLTNLAKAAAFAKAHNLEFIPYEGGFANSLRDRDKSIPPADRAKIKARSLAIRQLPAMAAVYDRFLEGGHACGADAGMIYAAVCNAGWGYMEFERQDSLYYNRMLAFMKRHQMHGAKVLAAASPTPSPAHPGAASAETFVAENDITAIETSKVSLMPPGLTNLLRRDEILDLLAFLRDGAPPE